MSSGVFVIAEAGVNHNGDLAKARDLVDVAAEAGADAVKFQTFSAERLTTARAATARYQQETANETSQREMLARLELSEDAFRELAERSAAKGVEFMSTGFDAEALAFLTEETGVRRVKIPSGEFVNPLLLLSAARSGLPVILSTGLGTMDEVRLALGVLAFGMTATEGAPTRDAALAALDGPDGAAALRDRVTVLHCVSEYPAAIEDTNLRAMTAMADAFGLPVGLSDHSTGMVASIAAVALGATMLEKHFTLDRDLPGPDHRASLDPTELTAYVAAVRGAHAALGDGVKRPTAAEAANLRAIRGSLVAKRAIAEGEMFSADNLAAKRPADGRPAMDLLDLVGRRADRAYAVDERIEV